MRLYQQKIIFMNKTITFIGPLPPPAGGVALANIRFQNLIKDIKDDIRIINLNTSRGLKNADLYKPKGVVNFFHFLKNIKDFFLFIIFNKSDVYNVFVVPNISFFREAIYITILKLASNKVFIHLHSKASGDLFLNGAKLKFFTRIIGFADVVFVLSEHHHKSFFLKYISAKKLVVLENFVNVKDFKNEIKHKKMHLLYVGRISEKKGFFNLVEAVSLIKHEFPEIIINVLGEFENKVFKKKVIDKIKRDKIRAFNFKGTTMGKEKLRFFKEASIFLFPSYFENSPIVLKEAIASGLAIIASDIIENRQLLDPYDCKIYFEAKNSNDLSKKIKFLLQNKRKLEEMKLSASKSKIFNYDDAKKVVESCLDNFL